MDVGTMNGDDDVIIEVREQMSTQRRMLKIKSIVLKLKQNKCKSPASALPMAPMILKKKLLGMVLTPANSSEVLIEDGRGSHHNRQTLIYEVVTLVVKDGLYIALLSDYMLSSFEGDVVITDDTQVLLPPISFALSSEHALRLSNDTDVNVDIEPLPVSAVPMSVLTCVRPTFPRLALKCVCDKGAVLSLTGYFSSLYQQAKSGGVLLFGESGTGKSTTVEGIAKYFHMPLYKLTTCDLFVHTSNTETSGGSSGSSVGGGGEYADLRFVSWCNRAIALQAPCILCIDDVENLMPPNGHKMEEDEMTAAVIKRVREMLEYCETQNMHHSLQTEEETLITQMEENIEESRVNGTAGIRYRHPFIWVVGVYNISKNSKQAASGRGQGNSGPHSTAASSGSAGLHCLPLAVQKLFSERFEFSAKFPESVDDRRRVVKGVYCAYKERVNRMSESDSPWGYHASADTMQDQQDRQIAVLEEEDQEVVSKLSYLMDYACPPNRKITAINYSHLVIRALTHIVSKRSVLVPQSSSTSTKVRVNTSPNSNNPDPSNNTFEVSGIFGHSSIRQQLHDALVLPALYHHHFQQCRLKMEIGVLLYGPPGTGKTLLVKNVAAQLKYNLVCIRLTDVVKGEIGTGEAALIEAFQKAKRNHPPCIVFIDEFQALFTAKDSGDSGGSGGSTLTSTLMSCLDDIVTWNTYAGPHSLVSVIAATNEPWAIDPSFLRPGRFDRCIMVGSLDKEARRGLILQAVTEVQNSHLSSSDYHGRPDNHGSSGVSATAVGSDADDSKTCTLSDFEIDFIVNATDGYTGADVAALIRKCKMTCIDKAIATTATVSAISGNVSTAVTAVTAATHAFSFSFPAITVTAAGVGGSTTSPSTSTSISPTITTAAADPMTEPLALTFDCWLTALQSSTGSVSLALRHEYESWSHK